MQGSTALLLIALVALLIMGTTSNPNPDPSVNSVADAIRYLQDLENKHAQYARPRLHERNDGVSVNALVLYLEQLDQKHARTPRFGKRGNNDLTKEYTNNLLRYMVENPEYYMLPIIYVPEELSALSVKMGKNSGIKILEDDKLNILCLHGYRQTAESFRQKTGSFRKLVKNYANFYYIDAPHLAKPFSEDDKPDENQKSWWFNNDDGSFKGTNQGGPAIGFEESLKVIEKAWSERNYQGLLGFSQGGCFVSLICAMSEKSFTSIKPRFAILASSFPSGSLVHKNWYENKISIPSLHISGVNDDIIPQELSIKLEQFFINTATLYHEGKHYFPGTSKEKDKYQEFFRDQLQLYLEDREMKSNGVEIDDETHDSS